jgi:hypothetical protein
MAAGLGCARSVDSSSSVEEGHIDICASSLRNRYSLFHLSVAVRPLILARRMCGTFLGEALGTSEGVMTLIEASAPRTLSHGFCRVYTDYQKGL